jgi:hypothetical protein
MLRRENEDGRGERGSSGELRPFLNGVVVG